MYKNLIILGSTRSGKSKLANIISETQDCVVQNTDNIYNALRDVYKQNDLELFYTNFLINFIKNLGSDFNYYNGKKYIIEINKADISKIIENIDLKKNEVIGLVYDHITAEEFYNYIKSTASSTDYISYLEPKILKSYISDYLAENKKLSILFDKLGIKKFDVSKDRDKVLEDISKIVITNPSVLKLKK